MRSIRASRPADRPAKKRRAGQEGQRAANSAHRGCTECFTAQMSLQLGYEQIIFYSSKDLACPICQAHPGVPLENRLTTDALTVAVHPHRGGQAAVSSGRFAGPWPRAGTPDLATQRQPSRSAKRKLRTGGQRSTQALPCGQDCSI
jgi:hypothetical protein